MAPSQSPSTATHRIGSVLLFFCVLAGIYCLHGLGFAGGLFPVYLQPLMRDPLSKWPSTSTPLLRRFTGISPIDTLLSNLNPFFATIADGSDPSLSIFSLFMLGQYGVGFALCMMEGLRAGNKGRVVSYASIFGFLMQTLGFAVAFPTWLFLHALTSPIAKPSAKRNSGNEIMVSNANLAVLPYSITIGYLIPSMLVALPSPALISGETRQKLFSFWQPFPLYVVAIQKLLSALYSVVFDSTETSAQRSTKSAPSTSYQNALSRAYTFLLGLAMTLHVAALLTIFLPKDLLAYLSPSIAAGLASSNVSFWSVYVPYLPLLSWRASSLSDGVHVFLCWDTYVSATAATIWAVMLLINASGQKVRSAAKPTVANTLLDVVLWTVLGGPFASIVILLWKRDLLMIDNTKRNA